MRAAKLPPTPVLPGLQPPGPRPPRPERGSRSQKHKGQARPELNGRQRCPRGPEPADRKCPGPPPPGPRVRRWGGSRGGGREGALGAPLAGWGRGNARDARYSPGWPARVPASPPARSAEPATLLLRAAALEPGAAARTGGTRPRGCALSTFSGVRLCGPMGRSPQPPLSVGFSRPEHWSRLPCSPPGDLPDPGIEPGSLSLRHCKLILDPLSRLVRPLAGAAGKCSPAALGSPSAQGLPLPW